MNDATGSLIEKSLPYMIAEGIHLVNASVGGTNNKTLNEAILNVQKHGTTFVCSAGNSGDRGVSPYARSGVWIAIGAVVLNNREEIKLTTYSSIDKAVDFVQFSEIYVNDVRKGYEDRTIYRSGTSFSSPLLVGMLALVQQFFYEKTGQYLNQDKLYQFMVDNSIDLGDVGKDKEYGHGLFVLPSPEDIDISKYVIENDLDDKEEEGEDVLIKFSDINNHWAGKEIIELVDKGIINGYSDGTFKPNKNITRAETVKIISNLLKYNDRR